MCVLLDLLDSVLGDLLLLVGLQGLQEVGLGDFLLDAGPSRVFA